MRASKYSLISFSEYAKDVKTPDGLYKAIEKLGPRPQYWTTIVRGSENILDFESAKKDAKIIYEAARRIAIKLRKSTPSLTKLPLISDDPFLGILEIQEWCIEANKKEGEKITVEEPEQVSKPKKWTVSLANEAIQPIIVQHARSNPTMLTARFLEEKTGCPRSTLAKTENWKFFQKIKKEFRDGQGKIQQKTVHLSDDILNVAEKKENGTAKLHKSHNKKNPEG